MRIRIFPMPNYRANQLKTPLELVDKCRCPVTSQESPDRPFLLVRSTDPWWICHDAFGLQDYGFQLFLGEIERNQLVPKHHPFAHTGSFQAHVRG
jgi:hypothetical protein